MHTHTSLASQPYFSRIFPVRGGNRGRGKGVSNQPLHSHKRLECYAHGNTTLANVITTRKVT